MFSEAVITCETTVTDPARERTMFLRLLLVLMVTLMLLEIRELCKGFPTLSYYTFVGTLTYRERLGR